MRNSSEVEELDLLLLRGGSGWDEALGGDSSGGGGGGGGGFSPDDGRHRSHSMASASASDAIAAAAAAASSFMTASGISQNNSENMMMGRSKKKSKTGAAPATGRMGSSEFGFVPSTTTTTTNATGKAKLKKIAVPIGSVVSVQPFLGISEGVSPKKRTSSGNSGSVSSVGNGSSDGEVEEIPGEDKKSKRRRQIAAASRASRARRKREMDDLREENKRLREERSQFLNKIGELQMKVENLRERGTTDMRIENELLRAQLEEHKRFVGSFKALCEGAPNTLNAKHNIYRQGSDTAQAHVMSIVSQSQNGDWMEAIAPEGINLPYQNFCMHYKFSQDQSSEDALSRKRRRLDLRIDVLFPAMDAALVADFFWEYINDSRAQARTFRGNPVELTALEDDMPDRDTKMVYYREKHTPPERDVDWVIICNRRKRELAKSTLVAPGKKLAANSLLGATNAFVLALTTAQHSVAPQFDNTERFESLFVHGSVTWNVGADSRACLVFSLPEDFRTSSVKSLNDILDHNGVISQGTISILQNFNELMGEYSHDSSMSA